MLKNEGVDEEINGLERQGCSDDGEGDFTDEDVISGLLNALKQHERSVGSQQSRHDGPAFVLRGRPALDIH